MRKLLIACCTKYRYVKASDKEHAVLAYKGLSVASFLYLLRLPPPLLYLYLAAASTASFHSLSPIALTFACDLP